MTTRTKLVAFAAALAVVFGGAALAGGAVLVQLPSLTACVDPVADDHSVEQTDWAQYEGIRNTDLVSYTGDWWGECTSPNTRFGCGGISIHLKLRVRPVAGADLAWKRVGVVYHMPQEPSERTAIGEYYTTWANGDEEWHVTVTVPAYETTVLFDAWYQDGTGHTWVDDNQGELHVVNDGPDNQVVRVEPWNTTPQTISVQVEDLDYDKQVVVRGTVDGWQTQFDVPAYYVETLAIGRERWHADITLAPGQTLEYAVVYRHGVVNGAREYEFWDNNFHQNYTVTAPATPATN